MLDCYIVGKGQSLIHLEKEHFGHGIVFTINSAIAKVEYLGIPNQIYSMQKDGSSTHEQRNDCKFITCHKCPYGSIYPKSAVLLVHRWESLQCMQNYKPRIIFDAELYGLQWSTESALVIIEMALFMGCDNFHFLCFDSVTNGSTISINPDGSIDQNTGNYTEQAKRLLERVKDLQHEFIEPK